MNNLIIEQKNGMLPKNENASNEVSNEQLNGDSPGTVDDTYENHLMSETNYSNQNVKGHVMNQSTIVTNLYGPSFDELKSENNTSPEKEFSDPDGGNNKINVKDSANENINQTDGSEKMKQRHTRYYDVIFHVKEFLKNNFVLRYNVISNKIEYMGISEQYYIGEFFQELNDSKYSSLYLEIQKTIPYPVSHTILTTILTSDFVPNYNPFIELIDQSLLNYDPERDYIGEIIHRIPTNDFPYLNFIFRKWFVGLVACTLDEKTENHLVLVLKGDQGIGKTRFLRSLIPDSLRDFIYEGNINAGYKEHERHLAEKLLIILDEFELQSDRQSAAFKSLITRNLVTIRRPYAKNPTNLSRIATFAATTNQGTFLRDKTGNRRFAVIEVTGSIVEDIDFPIEFIYAQAKSMIENGFRYYLVGEEIQYVNRQNESYISTDYEEDLLTSVFRRVMPDEPRDLYLTATEITQEVCKVNKIPFNPRLTQKIGTVLSSLNFQSGKSSGSKRYEVKRIK